MPVLHIKKFHGLAPRKSPFLLKNEEAQVATNAKLRNETLRPWKQGSIVTTMAKGSMTLASDSTIFYYPINDVWLHWPYDVDVVRAQNPDTEDRVYYTGAGLFGGTPKMTYSSIAGASGDVPVDEYELGIPAPTSALTVLANGLVGETEDEETRQYVYTYVSAKGEEGPPSDASNRIVTNVVTQTVDVSNFIAAPIGDYNISLQRIYRTVSTTTGTVYQFVAERAVSGSNYNDNVATLDLGEILPSATWDPPASNMIGLVAMPNEILAGFYNNTVAFSEPGFQHAWPVAYEVQLDYDIVAMAVYGETLVVGTTGNPYLFSGVHPASISAVKLELDQACVSKHSMVDMGNFVVYASPDGLIMVGPGVVKNITESIFTKDEWTALIPSTIRACKQDGMYIGFFNDGTERSFIIDPDSANASFTYNDQYSLGCFNDLLTDTMYMHEKATATIRSFDTGTNQTYTWKSKKYRVARPKCPGAAQVFADDYPLTFKFYADGQLKHIREVTDDVAFRLPNRYRARDFEIQLEGTATVHEVIVADNMTELSVV